MQIAGAASLRQCLDIQRRVLHALMMREVITRFGRENLGVLWLIGEPVIFTLGVATLWSLANLRHSSMIPIVAFAVTGYSSVLMWRNASNHAGAAVAQNKSLLFHRSVRVIDVLITRAALEIGGASASFILLSSLFIFIGWMPMPADPLKVLFGWGMLAWFGMALAIFIGAGSSFSEVVVRLWHPITYLLFPLSGAAFMVDWLPERLQGIVMVLPMVHGVEILREGFFGGIVPAHYDVGYMAVCCLVLSLAGLSLASEASRRVQF
jgi:capsular polysaccharide transport system permease protein